MRKPYTLAPLKAKHETIGRGLDALEECRDRTLRVIVGLNPDHLDRVGVSGHSIGSLLYHIAAIEMDWLFTDVAGADWPPGFEVRFPVDVRDEAGRLSHVSGETIADHLERLGAVREQALRIYGEMDLPDFRRARDRGEYQVSPEWVLHHLIQHESEHRMEISLNRTRLERDQ